MKILTVTLVTALLFTGCFRMQLDTTALDKSVYLSNKSPKPYTRLKDFTVQTNGSWTVFGLITLSTPELSEVIRDEIARQNGDAVINLTIKSQTTFTDGLIGTLALFGLIYTPRTVYVSGTVVAFDKESSHLLLPSADLAAVHSSDGTVLRAEGIVNERTKFTIAF